MLVHERAAKEWKRNLIDQLIFEWGLGRSRLYPSMLAVHYTHVSDESKWKKKENFKRSKS